MPTAAMIEELARCPMFATMSPSERQDVLGLVEFASFPKGSTILQEGKVDQCLWIVLKGKCEVVKTARSGAEQPLATVEPYAAFGEMSFFAPAPHSATIRTLDDVELLRLTRERYDQLWLINAMAAHKISFNTAKVLAERLRRMDDWTGNFVEKPEASRHREEWRDFRAKLYSDWQF